jgi:hypothetical protein
VRVRQVGPPAFVLMLLAALMTERLTETHTPLLLIAFFGYLLTLGIASAFVAF